MKRQLLHNRIGRTDKHALCFGTDADPHGSGNADDGTLPPEGAYNSIATGSPRPKRQGSVSPMYDGKGGSRSQR